MRRLILGTAGHIDHGKTRLVQALTGVDTDRLMEEKRRGITIDLGFAPLTLGDSLEMGVVDVPGHEAFIRNMLAGATGVDLVVLVVAADEGVMPQTREHLAIAELLGVSRGVVAVTKRDLVEEEWLDLVLEELGETLRATPFATWPRVAVSAATGAGLDALRGILEEVAERVPERLPDDLFRLPVDRVFTVRGTGTVATGTVWQGRLTSSETVRVLPQELDARVRGLQLHGREAHEVVAGQRAAVALTGVDRQDLRRGSVLVTDPGWVAHHMLTTRVRLLADSAWSIEHRQRVRFHLGTAEVMARVSLMEAHELLPGEEGWAQLRLEEPVVARAGDRFVLRSYSPVTTIGGGVVVEPTPRKRKRLTAAEQRKLTEILSGDPPTTVGAVLELAGWRGIAAAALPMRTGLPPERNATALSTLGALRVGTRVFDGGIGRRGQELLVAAVDVGHEQEPLRPGIAREELRRQLPGWADPGLADALLDGLVAEGALEVTTGVLRRPGFERHLSAEQEAVRRTLGFIFRRSGLEAPDLNDLPADLAGRPDLWQLVRYMEDEGELVCVAPPGGYADRESVAQAARSIRRALGGRRDLGPTDFKEVLGLSRKHLIPLLEHFDRSGVTTRKGEGRTVSAAQEEERNPLEAPSGGAT